MEAFLEIIIVVVGLLIALGTKKKASTPSVPKKKSEWPGPHPENTSSAPAASQQGMEDLMRQMGFPIESQVSQAPVEEGASGDISAGSFTGDMPYASTEGISTVWDQYSAQPLFSSSEGMPKREKPVQVDSPPDPVQPDAQQALCLSGLNQSDLARAIVLKEILDKPVALRGTSYRNTPFRR